MLGQLNRRVAVATAAKNSVAAAPVSASFLFLATKQPQPARSIPRRHFAADAVARRDDSKSSDDDSSAHGKEKLPKPTPYSQPSTIGGIIDKYGGLYPLIGLGGILALSKEYIVMNEELLMVSNFVAVAVAGYVLAGEPLMTNMKERQEADKKFYSDWGSVESEGLRKVIEAHKRNLRQADAVRFVKDQVNTLAVQAYKANNVQAQIAARDAIEKKLQDILGREQAEQSNYARQLATEATEYVRNYFQKADKQIKMQTIENAIALLSGQTKSIPADKDPVKQAFLKFFKENQGKK